MHSFLSPVMLYLARNIYYCPLNLLKRITHTQLSLKMVKLLKIRRLLIKNLHVSRSTTQTLVRITAKLLL